MYQTTATHNVNYWLIPVITKRELTAMDIIDATCIAFGIAKIALLGLRQDKELVRARYVCMYVMRLKVKIRGKQISLKDTGKSFNRDHTTAIHGIRAIENDLSVPAYRQETNEQIRSVIELL